MCCVVLVGVVYLSSLQASCLTSRPILHYSTDIAEHFRKEHKHEASRYRWLHRSLQAQCQALLPL